MSRRLGFQQKTSFLFFSRLYPFIARSLVAIKYCLIFFLVILLGCVSVKAPIAQIHYSGPESDGKTLIVALRGIRGSIKTFEQIGFIRDLHRDYPKVDVVVPNAHIGYYKKGILIEKLETDVIRPAKQQGYKHIWLLGLSLLGRSPDI